MFKSINDTLTGDGENQKGLIKRVKTVEKDLYDDNKSEKGLCKRVETLETQVKKKSGKQDTAAGRLVSSTEEIQQLQLQVHALQQSNDVLLGFSSKLQKKAKSLQNELYIQKDRQNFLNLLLGGVHEVEDSTPKAEVTSFFKDILQIPAFTETDIVKAYRKSAPKDFQEHVEDEEGAAVVLQVHAPGLMSVRLQSKRMREQAVIKAQGLGGRRHPVHNHKYFVSPVECEATKATKNKYRNKVQALLKNNKDNNATDKYSIQGEDFFINSALQKDAVTPPPMFAEVATAITTQQTELNELRLLRSATPQVENGSTFTAFLVPAWRLDSVKLAYCKVYAEVPDASSVMMAFCTGGNVHGSCNDGEYNTGYHLLHLLQTKKVKNVAIFVARHYKGQHLGFAWFQYITDTASKLINTYLAENHTEIGSPTMEVASPTNSTGRRRKKNKSPVPDS